MERDNMAFQHENEGSLPHMEKKSFVTPDEVRTFPNGKVETVEAGGITFGKATLEPGWKWSESVKPIAQTESCGAAHTQYFVSGTLHVVMDNGEEMVYKAGDVGIIPPGHDAWVEGNETVVAIDITGLKDYAKPS